jgi:shikimate dehydrogenase
MPANYKAELVGCFGRPVAENPTGVMKEAGFAAANLNWRYITVEVAPEDLGEAMRGVRAFGMRGINLTIPHKVAVMQHLDDISLDAAIIGAVNTVRREGNKLIGENTDGKGFLRGLRNDAGVDPKGKRIVLLGAGGAARAIATEVLLGGAADVLIVNRSAERGELMVRDLKRGTGGHIHLAPWEGTYHVPAGVDVLVNATPAGLYPNVDEMPDVDLSASSRTMTVCDAVFNPAETRLLRAARDRNLPTLDGLSMLVYQGVIGFQMWTGVAANEQVMKEALRKALAA